MTRALLTLTLRQLLGKRRTALMALLAAMPVLIAVIYRVTDGHEDPYRFVANGVLGTFFVGFVLPVLALVFGTAALGQEFEDGTAVYLLAKPVRRWKIAMTKLIGAWLVTALLVAPAVVATGLIVLSGKPGESVVLGFAVAALAGSFAYVALFVSLGARFSRALIIGLFYVFVWEALLSDIFRGAQYFSVREFTLGFADSIATVPPDLFEARLTLAAAIIGSAIVVVAAVAYGIRTLRNVEYGERT